MHNPIRSAAAIYQAFLFNLLKPPKQESVVEWVEDNVIVPVGPHQGKLSMSLIPYGREIVQRFGNRATRHLVLCFGSQAAKSTLLILGMLYRIARDPKDTLWVMGNKDMGTAFSKERWMPFAEACAPVAQLIPRTVRGLTDRHRFGFSSQQFVNMVLNFVGSNSPTNLSSRPVGMLVCDETDKYQKETKFEAGALELAEERNKAYAFPLVAKASTPTLESGIIWPEFLKTDQRYYNVPCPRCGQEIVLKFTIKSETHGDCGLRWWRDSRDESKTDGEWDMQKVLENAFYRCQKCGGEIYNHERPTMLEAGTWKPTNPRAEHGRFGYHLSSLYSILSDETSFGNIAVKWLLNKNLISGKQNFINSWLAETWDESRMHETKEIVTEVFDQDDTPKDATNIGIVDVQELGQFWVLVRRFQKPTKDFPSGQSWLLHADLAESEEELVDLQKKYNVAGENFILDMRHSPNKVGRLIVKYKWRGMLGTDTKGFRHKEADDRYVEKLYSTVQFRDPHMGTAWQHRTMERAMYFKFYKSGALDLVSGLRYSKQQIWHVNANVSPRYMRQINSKTKTMEKNKRTGRPEWFWRDLHTEDHLLDCEAGAAVRAVQLGLLSVPDESTG